MGSGWRNILSIYKRRSRHGNLKVNSTNCCNYSTFKSRLCAMHILPFVSILVEVTCRAYATPREFFYFYTTSFAFFLCAKKTAAKVVQFSIFKHWKCHGVEFDETFDFKIAASMSGSENNSRLFFIVVRPLNVERFSCFSRQSAAIDGLLTSAWVWSGIEGTWRLH